MKNHVPILPLIPETLTAHSVSTGASSFLRQDLNSFDKIPNENRSIGQFPVNFGIKPPLPMLQPQNRIVTGMNLLHPAFPIPNPHEIVRGPQNELPLSQTLSKNADQESAAPNSQGTDSSDKTQQKQALQSNSKKISNGVRKNREPGQPARITWRREEDEKISQLIKEHGKNWALISKKFGGKRTGKQIRDRYMNKLNPKIVPAMWSYEEDNRLLELFKFFGRKWTQISRQLPGRTETMVKNRFYSKFRYILEKQTAQSGHSGPEIPTLANISNFMPPMFPYHQNLLNVTNHRQSNENRMVQEFDKPEYSLPRNTMDGMNEEAIPGFAFNRFLPFIGQSATTMYTKDESQSHMSVEKIEQNEKIEPKVESLDSHQSGSFHHNNVTEEMAVKIEHKIEHKIECQASSETTALENLGELVKNIEMLEEVLKQKIVTSQWTSSLQALREKCQFAANKQATEDELMKEVHFGISNFKKDFQSALDSVNVILEKFSSN